MEQVLHSQYFHVDGIRCARCIQAIESALTREPEVMQARVNMSTHRLLLQWSGDTGLMDRFMQLVEALGYHIRPFEKPETTTGEDRYLLRCMAVAGFAMGNIMLLSVALWSSQQDVMGIATRDMMHWLSAMIALPAIAYAGRPFFASALSVLKKGHTNMDVPISLALILACAMSLFETFDHGEHAYFDSAVMLLFFLLIGRWLDARARGKAREHAQALLTLMQGYATVLEDGKPRSIPISELQATMVVRVAAGEKIPSDAEVMEGDSEIDTSLVTGETLPRFVGEGDKVYGGTINLNTPLVCRILTPSEESVLADIIRLMEQAEQGRARYVRLADKAARLYTPVVHTLAACAFIGWYVIGGIDWQDALLIAITTLIITCPCALGLAVPVVQVLASSWLMKRGILLKTGDALERLAAIDTVVFDKTGTLTKGKPQLMEHEPGADFQLAASLAAHSRHPYSQAISRAYDGELLPLTSVQEVAGIGVDAIYHGQRVRLGKIDASPDEVKAVPQIGLFQDNKPVATFRFSDTLRDDAQRVIQVLDASGLDNWLLSGDREPVAAQIAHEVGITHWQGALLPADKTQKIQQLQEQGHRVLMVGDGLNDAPSLVQANISMSPATGMDITQNSADMVFQGECLAPVLQAWRMARFSTKLVKQNFTLAVLYNCIAIPIALLGYVTPLIAAIAMSLSSLIVIANSFRINRLQELL